MNRVDVPLTNSEKRRELRRSYETHQFNVKDLSLAGIVIVAMIISLTDFTLSAGDIRKLTALALFLYVVATMVYHNRYDKGKFRGREDKDYLDSLGAYRTARKKISDEGATSEVPEFCREYKVRELREYREGMLADVDLNYDEYMQKYRHLPFRDVMKLRLPFYTRRTIVKCNRAKPIKLTPGMILNEDGEADRNKLIGQSGRERERIDKRKYFIRRGLVVLLGCMIVVDVILDFSVITIIQWFVRMLPIFSAIIMGDDSGYCDIVVTENNFKRGQTTVIGLFFEYRNSKRPTPIPDPIPDPVTENTVAE